METELAEGKLGTVGQYDVAFKDGFLVVDVGAAIPLGSLGIVLKVDAAQIVDAIAKAIPGTLDDVILGVLKTALLGK